MLSAEVTKEFNDLLKTGKSSGRLRTDLVGFLSKAIRTASRDPQDALLHLQKSLLRATTTWQSRAVSSLLELNANLDSSSDTIDSALVNALVGLHIEELDPDASPWCMLPIKVLVNHGANVLLKNEMGISAIEKAAECGVAATFQVFGSPPNALNVQILCTSSVKLSSRTLSCQKTMKSLNFSSRNWPDETKLPVKVNLPEGAIMALRLIIPRDFYHLVQYHQALTDNKMEVATGDQKRTEIFAQYLNHRLTPKNLIFRRTQ
jgi:hypothetical protein